MKKRILVILLSAVFFGNFKLAAQYWNDNGNTGTSLPNNFLGTLDNMGLAFRTNNQERMRIGNAGKVGIGTKDPDALLHLVNNAAASLTTPGSFLIGLKNNFNLTFDVNDIQSRNNDAASSLRLNAYGGSVSIGSHGGINPPAMYAHSDGRVGIGSSNVAANYALTVNSSSNGINITDPVNGYSIYSSKSGTGHAVYALKTTTADNASTIYGNNSGSGGGVSGNSSDYYGVLAFSNWGNGLYASTTNGQYAGVFNGDILVMGTVVLSDQKFKKNIRELTGAMSVINNLHVKQYEFKQDGDYKFMNLPKGNRFGLIAQDVEKILPNLVKDSKLETRWASSETNESTLRNSETVSFKALNYTELIPLLIRAMQEQHLLIEQQQQQIEELKTAISTKKNNSSISSVITTRDGSLEQNNPNPFTNTTIISYTLPQKFTMAQITITDKNGKLLKQANVSGAGKGTLNVNAAILSAGTYNYSLIIDGRVISSKQMVLTK